MFSTHCCSCEASNSAARKRRAVAPNAAIEASYQVVVDSNPPNAAPLNTSTIRSTIQDTNQAVANEGVVIDGVKVTGTVIGNVATVKGRLESLITNIMVYQTLLFHNIFLKNLVRSCNRKKL